MSVQLTLSSFTRSAHARAGAGAGHAPDTDTQMGMLLCNTSNPATRASTLRAQSHGDHVVAQVTVEQVIVIVCCSSPACAWNQQLSLIVVAPF
jgi:hypothetical protein